MNSIVLAAFALRLITLHTVEGYVVHINPAQVTTLTMQKTAAKKNLLHPSVRCLIGFADGKFVSVVETCDAVRKAIEGARE